MFKGFILSFAAVCCVGSAHAAITTNAITTNAITTNAITTNAITTNAITTNAITTNALAVSGPDQGGWQVIAIEFPAGK